MDPSKRLIDDLAAEDRRQAQAMTPWQRFRAGGDLFDEACRWTLAGIRQQFPRFTNEEAMTELRRRLQAARVQEEKC